MGGPNFTFVSYVRDHAARITLLLTITLGLAITASAAEGRSADAQVSNAPPTADIGGPYIIEEGATGALDATGSSDSDGAITLYEWDLDDDGVYGETGLDAANGDETGSEPVFSAALLDGPLAHPISLRVTDDLGGTDTADSTVSVTNVTVADAGGPYTVAEGGSVTLAATSDDPAPADTVEFAWDFNDDGVYDDATGADAEFIAAGLDGPGSATISVQVTDDDGGTVTSDATVNIENAAPTALLENDGPIAEGGQATVTFSDPQDASAPDSAAGFTYSLDFGNDGTFEVTGSSDSSQFVPLSYTADGPADVEVRGRIEDKDGGASEYVTTISVENMAPSLDAGDVYTGDLTAPLTLSAVISDPGDDIFTATVDWGDGAPTPEDLGIVASSFSASHNYGDSGPYFVTLTVTDDDGGTDQSSLVVVIFRETPLVTQIVNSTGDATDLFPGDGICFTGGMNSEGAPECTLRAAIENSNASAGDNEIEFGIPGSDPGYDGADEVWTIMPATPLPAVTDTVSIDGYTQPGAAPNTNGFGLGLNTVLKIQLDGSLLPAPATGLELNAPGNTVRGLSIGGFTGFGDTAGGIIINPAADGNFIQGNFLGVAPDGQTATPNSMGMHVFSAENSIGSASPEDRNLISGNAIYGFELASRDSIPADGNVISGNIIGLAADGVTELGNFEHGFTISTSDNVIGGDSREAGNVISGNRLNGIEIQGFGVTGNQVTSNLIGTDVTGMFALGNGASGIDILVADENFIGGSSPDAGNVISGNGQAGIKFSFIIFADPEFPERNIVQGNLIGVDITGTGPLGNAASGVELDNSANNLVGGVEPGAGNMIAHNGSDGVSMRTFSFGNSILGNSIHSNGGLGINLGFDEVTPNDEDDPDGNPNGLQNFPVISSAISGGVTTVISGSLNSVPGSEFVVEMFSSATCDPSGFGEGAVFLGSLTVMTDAGGDVDFDFVYPGIVSAGHVITATATHEDGSTSEFSECLAVEGASVPVADAGGPYGVPEGGAVGLDASGSTDLDSAIVLYEWDFDADGEFDDATGVAPVFSAASLDGPLSVIVSLRVTDDTGLTSTVDATVNIENAAPAVTVIGDSVTVGATATVAIGFTDPSPTDTHTAVIDWGDGSPVEDIGAITSPVDVTHVYSGPDIFVVTVTVTDSDGSSGEGTANVQVETPAPDFFQVVNSTGDGEDLTLLDGICWTGGVNSEGAPECTLRAAIEQSNFTSGFNAIQFDIPDSDAGFDGDVWTIAPATSLPAVIGTVSIDGYTQPGASLNTGGPGSGLDTALKIEIDGSASGIETGLTLAAADNDVTGIAIGGFTGAQISIASTSGSNIITGNFIGADASGATALGGGDGLYIQSSDNVIGGVAPGDRNLVSGNGGAGIVIAGSEETAAAGNVISGNIVGLAADGVSALGNTGAGVWLVTQANENLIGGMSADEGNVISGNGGGGISIALESAENQVSANLIGTDVTGMAAVGNSTGVLLSRADDNLIGGAAPEMSNLISGNNGPGIHLMTEFVLPESGRPENTIIQGNLVGVDITGEGPLGNTGHGVLVGNAPGTLIGGTMVEETNIIAFNGGDGVRVEYPLAGIAIIGNSIHSNAGLGIDLEGDGVSPNDDGDSDTGANNLQNFPVIESAVVTDDTITISGHLGTAFANGYLIELFVNEVCDPESGHGEGQLLLGSTLVNLDGTGMVAFSETYEISLPKGIFVTATATHPDGSTSEFSECAVTTGAPPVADAGGPYTVNEGGSTTLDGSGSTDPDGEIALFAWDFDGDGVTDAVGETPLFDATSLDGPDSFTVTLTVTDDEGLLGTDTAEVTVQNVNPSVSVTGDSIDEGQSATVEITFADGGADDTHEVVIDWGDGSAPESFGIVESPLSRSNTYEDDGTFTVTVTVTDDDGGVGEGTATVEVAPVNDPPVADAGEPYEVDEGSSVTLDGTASVDPDGSIVLYEWDFDGDSVTDATGDTALFDATLIDGPESFTITLTVTDDGGLTDTVTTSVSVLNVAPSVNASGDMVTLGETAAVDVEFTDPAAADSHSATIDWGDGSAVEDLGAVTNPFAPTHDYASADVYEVTVTITDNDGGVTVDTAFVTVMEEEELEPHEIWTQIDSGDDDAFHTPSGWPHYSDTEVVVHAGAPGSSGPTYGGFRWDDLNIPEGAVILEVYVELKQKDWGYRVQTTLALQDSPNGDSFSRDDSPYTRWAGSRSDFEMPWTADLKVPGTWISTPDLSEGVQELVNRYGGINSLVLLESGEGVPNGEYHNWRAFDLNYRTAAKLHIRYMAPNVAPVVDAGPDREITEGDMLQLNGASFVDGSEGAFTATIDWGDGTVEAGNVNPATHAVTGMHNYADDGVYTVTVSVTDASGKTGADTMTVTVNNAAPTVDAGPSQTSDTDTPVSLPPSRFTDPGLLDTHTATIDWGDGTVDAGVVGQGSGSGSVAGSHTYGIGAYTVEVCVTDDDGGVGCDTFSVVVEPPPGDIQEAWAMLLSGSDDAYHSPGGWPHYSDSDAVVYAGSPDGSGATYGGWRWSGLDIPEGAIILDAHVELTQSQWGYPVTTTLSLQDANSPDTFTPDSTPFDRWDGRTEFETSWTWPKSVPNSRLSTPDLAAGLQELIDRYGTIDALVLLESGEGTVNGEYHEWRSIESGPQYAPKLYIRYVAPNEEPVVEAGDSIAVTEGDTVSLSPASFDDTTAGDHTATIDWGDGTVEAGTVDQAAHTVFGSHVYGDNGVYTVTVTVTDVGELSGSDSFTVTVSNAAPVVNAGGDITVDEGEPVSLEPARFTDAGLLDTHTATIDWGDGTVDAGVLGQAPGEGTVAGSHTYAGGGVFTVQVCVTDDDLATGCDTLTATVNGAPEPEPGEALAQIASGSDDAYHSPGGWPDYSDSDTVVFAGAPDGSGPTYGGWRWTGLDIPEGAIITGAYVELKQSQWGHEVTTTLSLQDAASPATFTSGSTPFDRWPERSDFEMSWDWPKATPDTWISTPDLAAGVQELVDSHGGIDSLVLLESGEGVSDTEYHEWRSFESGAENAAKLHITWRFPEPLTPEWSGVGQVLFVGPSPEPSALTLTSAEFDLNEDGSINQVVVNTENEFVAGALFGGIGGGALTGCRDAEGGASCATLNSLLTGATVSSLHTSTATLTVFAESVIQVPLETPGGTVVLDVPIVSGSLVGQLEGLFIIDQGADRAVGTASMQINPGSSGTYACFELTALGPVPLTSLDACVNGTGGQFYPIILDVFDTGTFAVGQGTGALSEIVSLSGSVEVAAQSNLLLQEFGGTITITDAVAQMGGGSTTTTLTASAAALPNTQASTVIAARRRREEDEDEAQAS